MKNLPRVTEPKPMRTLLRLLVPSVLILSLAGCNSNNSQASSDTTSGQTSSMPSAVNSTAQPVKAAPVSCSDVDLKEGRTVDGITASDGADCATAKALATNEAVVLLDTRYENDGYTCVSNDPSDAAGRWFTCVNNTSMRILFNAHAFKDSQ